MNPVSGGIAMCGWLSSISRSSVVPEPMVPRMKTGPSGMARDASVRARVKVSVVVPVYNPGSNMDDLVRSVLGQSLREDEYEAIFVDDGSTDGTGERLDALAAEHEVIRVEHIPNS